MYTTDAPTSRHHDASLILFSTILTVSRQAPLLKGLEQRHPVGKLSPSEPSGVSSAVVAASAPKERPPIDLFKSIFESESESDSEEETAESGEATTVAASGEADATTKADERARQGLVGKISIQRGYGTDSSEESTGREDLIAEYHVGDHHSNNLEDGKADSDNGRRRGDKARSSRASDSGTRRSENGSRNRTRSKKKHKKHKSDKKESKSDKKHRKHERKRKKIHN